MTVLTALPSRLRSVLPAAICLCVIAYFGYHSIQGRHGLLSYFQYKADLVELRQMADARAAERADLDRRVAALDPKGVDRDYLDQKVREGLGFVDPNELIIPLEPSR
jgi:cell division protein FtsB